MRSLNVRLALLPLLVLAGGAACDRDPARVDGEYAAVLVHGYVLDPDGAPAPGVSVALQALRPGTCDEPSSDNALVETDASGRYRAILGRWGKRFTACIYAHAVAAPGTLSTPGVATLSPVELDPFRLDSVRVDVQLGSRLSSGAVPPR